MQNEKERKLFMEPSCDVISFAVEDILTTSGEDDDWGGGDIEIFAIEKP